ncbi:NADP-dependent oxidoreductase domain-containing protein [Pelagophyceae sp. CCMP2097]|nr:NADP-dependent oxidoreductase domain-containing protein [Pelagophyceae sp. CCMP2097]
MRSLVLALAGLHLALGAAPGFAASNDDIALHAQHRAVGRYVTVRGANGTEVRVPTMIYATANKRHDTADLVEKALRAGFFGVDTAADEGRFNDTGVGEALRRVYGSKNRGGYYVQLKVHHTAAPGKPEPLGDVYRLGAQQPKNLRGHPHEREGDEAAAAAERVRSSVERSLQNMGLDHVDVLLLRGPSAAAVSAKTLQEADVGAWREMQKLATEGKVSALGVCNFGAELLDELIALSKKWQFHVRPRILQTKAHAKTKYARQERAFCAKRGITVQTASFVTTNREEIGVGSPLHRIAALRGKSVEQVLLRFAMQLPIIPVVGTTSVRGWAHNVSMPRSTSRKTCRSTTLSSPRRKCRRSKRSPRPRAIEGRSTKK